METILSWNQILSFEWLIIESYYDVLLNSSFVPADEFNSLLYNDNLNNQISIAFSSHSETKHSYFQAPQ